MSAKSVVLELQALATDRKNDITDLLRKSLLVATKLGLSDFREWVNHELGGYRDSYPIPSYRRVRCELKLKNPYHGLIPVVFADQKFADAICITDVRDAIEGLDNLIRNEQEKGAYLSVPLSHAQAAALMELQDQYSQLPPVRVVGRNQVSAIVDSVRTKILEWALQLEKEGILGNGMSFTQEEQRKAMSSPSISIQNFQGVLGDVSNSSLTQNLQMDVRRGDFESLSAALKKLGVEEADINDLRHAISEDPEPRVPPKYGKSVSGWVGRMVSKAATGSWMVGLEAAGNILGALLLKYYGG